MIRIPATTPQNLIVSQSGPAVNPPIDKEIVDEVMAGNTSSTLSQEKALRLLDAIGVSRERTLIATNIDEARAAIIDLGFPINMENISVHEADGREIVESITDRNTMRLEFSRLMRNPGTQGILIRPSLTGARSYFGIRYREGLGHLVVCGTLSMSDKPSGFVCCTLPVTKVEASQIFQRVKGNHQVNEVVFNDTLRRLSALCSYAPQIDKMDIYPVVINARSVIALDASVTLRKTP